MGRSFSESLGDQDMHLHEYRHTDQHTGSQTDATHLREEKQSQSPLSALKKK